MKKKYLILLIGILISGCNSNGIAHNASPRLPQVIKSVASSVNNAKVGAVLGTYVCTFHDRKTKIFGGQIPTSMKVSGEFKKLEKIPFVEKIFDVNLFMPSEAPDYNKIMSQCEHFNLDPDGDVIDGVKVSTDLKSSILYDIYNPIFNDDVTKMTSQLNLKSNNIISNSIILNTELMVKSTYNDYRINNFTNDSPASILTKKSSGSPNELSEMILHKGAINDGSFKSNVFNPNKMPQTLDDIRKEINNALFYIDTDGGYASIQNGSSYKVAAFDNEKYSMIADFIAAYDWKSGFSLSFNNLTTSNLLNDEDIAKINWTSNKTLYMILRDETNDDLVHVIVAHQAEPTFNYTNPINLKEVLKIKPDLKYTSSIIYTLDVGQYKPALKPNQFGTQSIGISRIKPINSIFINEKPKAPVTKSTKDFMMQMIFNGYQGNAGVDLYDVYGKRNDDTWGFFVNFK